MSAAPRLQPILPKTVEIHNVLLATDFSASSEAALEYGRTMAMHYGAKLYVLHVLPPEPRLEVPLDQLPAEMDNVRQLAVENMERTLQHEGLKDLPHEALLERGPIEEVVTSAITEHDIDLLVVGTRGRRGVRKLLLGSVAEEIFRTATCPVMTIGPDVPIANLSYSEFPHIVFATDFSPGSLDGLPYALSLAKKSQARLTMLHVIEQISESAMDFLDEVTSACRQRLTELLPPGAGSWCRPEFAVEFGPPADMILKVAEEEQASLVVMGARRKPRIPGAVHLPWPTAYLVAAQATCPVLTVRQKAS